MINNKDAAGLTKYAINYICYCNNIIALTIIDKAFYLILIDVWDTFSVS